MALDSDFGTFRRPSSVGSRSAGGRTSLAPSIEQRHGAE